MRWIKKFKPKMIVYPEGEALIVAAVCAVRVFKARDRVVIKEAADPEFARRFLGG